MQTMSCNLGAVFDQEMEAALPSLAEKCSEFLRENLSNDDDVPCLAEFNLVSTKKLPNSE